MKTFNIIKLKDWIEKNINQKITFTPLAYVIALIFLIVFSILFIAVITYGQFSLYSLLASFITVLSIVLIGQSLFNLFWMIYAWDDPEMIEINKSPISYRLPKFSFSALLPARHEEKVIGSTISAISNIRYPEELKELIVVCRSDDPGTIKAAQDEIKNIGKSNIKVVVFDDYPINKPHGLNIGAAHASKDVIVIFDAEDEPHPNIYNSVNTVMQENDVDVIQCGVQLMNFNSTWFSTLNVLEYFFWFKSTLQFFSKAGLIPLGGNTVFFKRNMINKVGGWDEKCLTEDADIGIRLSAAGARIKVVYDEEMATREETPPNLASFIKQRTRWNQGFIQVFLKGDWLKLPKLSQRLLAAYILVWPEPQSLLLVFIPFSIMMTFLLKLQLLLAILSVVPIYLLILHLTIYNVGFYEFAKNYKIPYSPLMPLKIVLSFAFFQVILGISAFRAVFRHLSGNLGWEKTIHTNAHREELTAEGKSLQTINS